MTSASQKFFPPSAFDSPELSNIRSSSPPIAAQSLSVPGITLQRLSSSENASTLNHSPRFKLRRSSIKSNEVLLSRLESAESDLNSIFNWKFNRELEKLFGEVPNLIINLKINENQFRGLFTPFINRKDCYQFMRDLNQLFSSGDSESKNFVKRTLVKINSYSVSRSDLFDSLERLRRETSEKAYMSNIKNIASKIAKSAGRPLAIRVPSSASQTLQQMGYPTKPLAIKNKSSIINIIRRKTTLPGLDGFIPIDGKLGKYGTELKLLLNKCLKENKSFDCDDFKSEKEDLEIKIKNDTAIAENLLKETDAFGAPLYIPIPRTRKIYDKGQPVTQIALLDDSDLNEEHLKKIRWVQSDPNSLINPDLLPKNTAFILADRWGNPITADTDLLFLPTETRDPEVKYDPIYGNHTESDLEFIKKINQKWRSLTGNNNDIIQHGHEFRYGLNTLDGDVLLANSEGKVAIFTIPEPSASKSTDSPRASAFTAIANFIKADLDQAAVQYTVHIPTPEEQKRNLDALKKHAPDIDISDDLKTRLPDIDISYEQPKKDFKVMRDVLFPTANTRSDETKSEDTKSADTPSKNTKSEDTKLDSPLY